MPQRPFSEASINTVPSIYSITAPSNADHSPIRVGTVRARICAFQKQTPPFPFECSDLQGRGPAQSLSRPLPANESFTKDKARGTDTSSSGVEASNQDSTERTSTGHDKPLKTAKGETDTELPRKSWLQVLKSDHNARTLASTASEKTDSRELPGERRHVQLPDVFPEQTSRIIRSDPRHEVAGRTRELRYRPPNNKPSKRRPTAAMKVSSSTNLDNQETFANDEGTGDPTERSYALTKGHLTVREPASKDIEVQNSSETGQTPGVSNSLAAGKVLPASESKSNISGKELLSEKGPSSRIATYVTSSTPFTRGDFLIPTISRRPQRQLRHRAAQQSPVREFMASTRHERLLCGKSPSRMSNMSSGLPESRQLLSDPRQVLGEQTFRLEEGPETVNNGSQNSEESEYQRLHRQITSRKHITPTKRPSTANLIRGKGLDHNHLYETQPSVSPFSLRYAQRTNNDSSAASRRSSKSPFRPQTPFPRSETAHHGGRNSILSDRRFDVFLRERVDDHRERERQPLPHRWSNSSLSHRPPAAAISAATELLASDEPAGFGAAGFEHRVQARPVRPVERSESDAATGTDESLAVAGEGSSSAAASAELSSIEASTGGSKWRWWKLVLSPSEELADTETTEAEGVGESKLVLEENEILPCCKPRER